MKEGVPWRPLARANLDNTKMRTLTILKVHHKQWALAYTKLSRQPARLKVSWYCSTIFKYPGVTTLGLGFEGCFWEVFEYLGMFPVHCPDHLRIPHPCDALFGRSRSHWVTFWVLSGEVGVLLFCLALLGYSRLMCML